MQTFILETLLLLFLAFIVGAIIGSLLRWPFVRRDRRRLEDARARVRESAAERAKAHGTASAPETTASTTRESAERSAALALAGGAAATGASVLANTGADPETAPQDAAAAPTPQAEQPTDPAGDQSGDQTVAATPGAPAQEASAPDAPAQERRASPEQLTSTRSQSVADISRAAHGVTAGSESAESNQPVRRPVAAGSDGGSGAVADVVRTPPADQPETTQNTHDTATTSATAAGAATAAAATAALGAAALATGGQDQDAPPAGAPIVTAGAGVDPDEPLTSIQAITDSDATALNELGINRFEQIANMESAQVEELEQRLGAGRVSRENWIEQAAVLASGKLTAFAGAAAPGALSFTESPQAAIGSAQQSSAPDQTAATQVVGDSGNGDGRAGDEAADVAVAPNTGEQGAANQGADSPLAGAAAAAAGITGLGAVVAQRADADGQNGLDAASGSDRVTAFMAGLAAGPDEDLTKIDGVTADDVSVLNSFGVRRFEHVAALDTDIVGRIDRRIEAGPRVSRENWIEQAAQLAAGQSPLAAGQTPLGGPLADRITPAGASAPAGDVGGQDATHGETSEDVGVQQPSFQGTLAAAAAAAATGTQLNPQSLVGQPTPVPEAVPSGDDLTAIDGIDAHTQDKLKARGIRRWRDIASWTPSTVDVMETQLGLEGRIASGDWVNQAKRLNGEPEQTVSDASDQSVATAALGGAAAAAAAAAAGAGLGNDGTPDAAPNLRSDPRSDAGSSSVSGSVSDPASGQDTKPSSIPASGTQSVSTPPQGNEGSSALAPASPFGGGAPAAPATTPLGGAGPAAAASPFGGDARAPATASPFASAGTAPTPKPDAPAQSADQSPATSSTDALAEPEVSIPAKAGGGVTGLRSVRSAALTGVAAGGMARGAQPDDLKRIKGVGVVIEKKLFAMGITTYEQVAGFTEADIEAVSERLAFKGRIEREQWVEQARILAGGGMTDFARKTDDNSSA